ncbi:hypothetical protein SAY87_020476 [Trapa incisa]|uniref:C2 domain-containing protein n=2 Tax=Trapa TaxID=22665 RepID=A0AAN7M7N8_TRANT|nr:hypothetical protein SAY87_020476 [Trapa incisa]KAK4804598.1 hypothetical protein SAY86_004415 [Trapa natans]
MNPRNKEDPCEYYMANESAGCRSLEFTVISAEDLRIKGKHVKNNVFVTVKVENFTEHMLTTKVDPECGSYPFWNQQFPVDLPLRTTFLTIEVHRRNKSSHHRGQFIGGARIPVSDFIGDYAPETFLHLLSYRLRDSVGERNGIINVSVRTRTRTRASSRSMPPANSYGRSTSSKPEMGIPAGQQRTESGVRAGAVMVTGIPIPCGIPSPCKADRSS